eukprot:TRINITY_DN21890_c0_g1_i1.p1 TRINITY_DN21890_c0_g1~~TRINITY_DN21890_c0_g1_i1.p1  ORF type:complete len:1002 (-),score=217.58 TRINITY_DN21890_c0_g1_i1:148-3153(-)
MLAGENAKELDLDLKTDVASFVTQNNIDQGAAEALKALSAELQREVIAGGITGASNPSAVLLSRIKRIRSGQSARRPVRTRHSKPGRAALPATEAQAPPPPPPPPPPSEITVSSEVETSTEEFLERHGINADACQSLWELTPGQQREVIRKDLDATEDAYDALMSRISQVLEVDGHSSRAGSRLELVPAGDKDRQQRHSEPAQQVENFLKRHGVSAEGCEALRALPWEEQREVIAADMTGAKKPTAVLLSRISRVKSGQLASPGGLWTAKPPDRFNEEADDFLSKHRFDGSACKAFRELQPDQQRQVMRDDFSRCRNPSAFLFSRIKHVRSSASQTGDSRPQRGNSRDSRLQTADSREPAPGVGNADVVETFLRRHDIDEGGREALRQLPPELQLSVLAHDHEIGQSGRNPSQHLVSLVGKAWAHTLKPPQAADEHEAFLSQVDSAARAAFAELPFHLKQTVLEAGEIKNCRNPSGVLHSRIQRARRVHSESISARGAETSLLQRPPAEQALAPLPLSLPPPQPPALPPPPHVMQNFAASAVLAIKDEVHDSQADCQKRALAIDDEELHGEPLPKRRRPEPEKDVDKNLELAVEGFLRLNGIDTKSCRAMRRLPAENQRTLIEMDLRNRRNPSAFLWTQIQKLQHSSEDSENWEDWQPPASQDQWGSREGDSWHGSWESEPWGRNGKQAWQDSPMKSWQESWESMPHDRRSSPKRGEDNDRHESKSESHRHTFAEARSAASNSAHTGPGSSGQQIGHGSGDVAFTLLRSGGGDAVPSMVEVLTDSPPLLCGRANNCDIVLKIQHASKKHAELHPQRGANGESILMLYDISSNGTWIDGVKVDPKRFVRLRPGDKISFLPREAGQSDSDVPALEVMEGKSTSSSRKTPRDSRPREIAGTEKVFADNSTSSQKGLQQDDSQQKAAVRGDSSEVAEWIRSVGSGKLSDKLITEIEDSYEFLRQIYNNYRHNVSEFLDVHGIKDPEEQELLSEAIAGLDSLQGGS